MTTLKHKYLKIAQEILTEIGIRIYVQTIYVKEYYSLREKKINLTVVIIFKITQEL